ncbi:MAG TPA: GNAT family N-acetyltransferase [Anaerolineae bacterium]|nr:GNAT family N-acetyltransferase [Anaerolineae bacterium]
MPLELISGPQAFTTLAPQWDNLVATSATNTPFQFLAYQQAWWQHLAPDGAQLYTFTYSDNDSLQAIACFYLLDNQLHFNGCVEETDYLDIIASADTAPAVWAAIVDALQEGAIPNCHALDLCNIPAASPSRPILADLATARNLTHSTTVQEVCPIIDLPDSFDDYLGQLDKKQRHEIRRKLRRANGAELEVEMFKGTAEELTTAVNLFLDLLQKSTIEKNEWLNDGRRALFHDTAQAAYQAGTLQLLFTVTEDERAATLFNFNYAGRIWVYNSGLDPVAFGYLSPGVVLTARAIEMAIENGQKTFDFLRGDEEYKYQFGAQDSEIFRVQLNLQG